MGYFVAKLTKIQGFRNWNNFAAQLIYISFCGFRIPYLDNELMDCLEGFVFFGVNPESAQDCCLNFPFCYAIWPIFPCLTKPLLYEKTRKHLCACYRGCFWNR